MEKFEIILFAALFIHWIADFIFQSDEDAKNKSKSMKHLLSHTFTYSLTWFCALVLLKLSLIITNNDYYWIESYCLYLFVLVTFTIHTITDYLTSRLNSKLWAEGKVHNFFVSIGFDQILHYIQLYFTIKYLLWLPTLQYL